VPGSSARISAMEIIGKSRMKKRKETKNKPIDPA
jgi:hypothetical protein